MIYQEILQQLDTVTSQLRFKEYWIGGHTDKPADTGPFTLDELSGMSLKIYT